MICDGRIYKFRGYNSIFKITEENKRFEVYTDSFDEFSFEELRDELEEILSISDITPYHLQHEKKGRRVIEAYKKLKLEKSGTDGYIFLLMGYARSPFRGFKIYLRKVVGLDDVNIQSILKQYFLNFVTYKLNQGFTLFEILQRLFTLWEIMNKAVYTMGDHKIKHDDIRMKTKLISTRFGSTFGTLRFDESFFSYFTKIHSLLGL